MGKTFQEQMLQLGLVDKKKASQNKKQKHQKKKKQGKVGKTKTVVDENALIAQKAEEKKKARARQLNKEREAKLQKRADAAQVRQIVEQNKIAKDEKGVAYRFNAKGKIQRIFVEQDIADQLSAGSLGIVSLQGKFEVVPRKVVEKIEAIDKKIFLTINSPKEKKETDPDDPYAEFQVPDDLMW